MKIKIFKPTWWHTQNGKVPYVKLSGLWLNNYGFEPDKYFNVEYMPNEAIFRLEEENNKFVGNENVDRKKVCGKTLNFSIKPVLSKSSVKFKDIGFEPGKPAVAKCEYGCIRVFPIHLENADLMTVSSLLYKRRTTPIANIHLSGVFLANAGFTLNKLVHINYSYGKILLKACGEGSEDYFKIRKSILANRKGSLTKVFQKLSIHTKEYYPFLNINESWLELMGFAEGTPIIVKSEYGIVDISILDLETTSKKAI
jgi:hypothetical protein